MSMNLLRRGLQSIRDYGLKQTADTAVRLIVERLRDRYYVYDGFDYDIRDALLWPYGIDVWARNGIAIDELDEIGVDRSTTVLDVGAGGEGIMKVGKYSNIGLKQENITRIDIDSAALDIRGPGDAIVGDGCSMPFKDGAFDIVISIDSLEHVPEERRDEYLREIKRIGRGHVLLHFPLSSSDGLFVGRESDEKYQNWHVKRLGYPEPNTAEHLRRGYPKYEYVTSHFNPTEIRGVQNSSIWLTYMKLSKLHLTRFFTGIYYYFIGKHKDNRPPYHGCFIHHKLESKENTGLNATEEQ